MWNYRLTPADETSIQALAATSGINPDMAVNQTTTKVWFFAQKAGTNGLAAWRLKVAEELTQQTLMPRVGVQTDEAVIEAIRAAMAEEIEMMMADWPSPEFSEWWPEVAIVNGVPVGSPRGDVTALEAWLAATPYQVWKLSQEVAEAVQSELDDGLLDLATNSRDRVDLSSVAERAFTKAVRAFEASVARS